MKFKPGIYYDMPMSEYKTIPGLNKSSMSLIKKNLFLYHNSLKKIEKKISRALAIGTALDLRLFEPEEYKQNIKIHPLKTPRVYQVEDRIIYYIHPDDRKMIETMYTSLTTHPLTSKILASGRSQVTLLWNDHESGISCKARPDFICEDLSLIVDLKTTRDASYDHFKFDAKKFKYHWQGAFYQAGYLQLTGKLFNFIFMCIETQSPYAKEQISVYQLPQIEIDAAIMEIDEIKLKYKDYIQNKDHTGYPEIVTDLYLP